MASPLSADFIDEANRERGWKGILVGLALFLLVPAIPPLRILAPLEQTIVLVAPLIAVSALIAWWAGGRFWLAALWTATSVWMLWQPLRGGGSYDALGRGWAILLAAVFGVVNLVGLRRPFLSRALSTLALTFAFAAAVILVSNASPSRVHRTLSNELDRRVTAATEKLAQDTQTPEWQRFAADHPSLARLVDESNQRLQDLPRWGVRFFPALLGLESLAALALAWGLFHRISRARIGPPLRPLRRFHLSDQLIWGFLAGVAIIAIPSLESLRGFGLNLVLFFGALYALRGLGVLTWFIAPRRLAMALFVVLAVVFWPIAVIVSVGLGLGDTWIDWRGRVRQMT
jgi:hypothetical protein